MGRKTSQGGIERKFVTSILWVGVIPMALALVIGFWFAREGQQAVVRHDLANAARTAAHGIALAIDGRMELTRRAARSRAVVAAIEAAARGEQVDIAAVSDWLNGAAAGADAAQSSYALYDKDGKLVAGGDEADLPPAPRRLMRSVRTQVLGFEHAPAAGGYVLRIAAPVHSPSVDRTIGYLLETQNAEALIKFALGQNLEHGPATNEYELADLSRGRNKVIYYEDRAQPGETHPVLRESQADERLAANLKNTEAHSETLALSGYASRGRQVSVLLAYHSLFPGSTLYLLVYRATVSVYSEVYLATFWTILVSFIVIGALWIRTYRRVNMNIIRPVSLLNEGAQIIRQGDLELKLKIDTGDEIEELAHSFNKMAAALSHNINQLEESEEKYRSLITSMRDGIYQTNEAGEITLINPAGVDILGHSKPDSLIGLTLRELFIEQMDFARVTSDLAKYHFVERTRVWMKKQDAPAICVELSANSVFDENGVLTGMEGIFRDVTHNVRLEQKARERSERIDAINQIANAINSSLEAGRVYESIVVEMRSLIHFDYADVALLGEAAGETGSPETAQTFEVRQLWPEPAKGKQKSTTVEDERSCAAWVARERKSLVVDDLLRNDTPFSGQFPGEIRSCLCVPLYAAGRIIGTLNLGNTEPGAFTGHEIEVMEQMSPHMAVAIRNATLLDNLQHSLEEVTLARENLHAAIEELKTLDEMKTNLLSNVSHELRTPLVAVMGYTDMILNGKVGHVNDVQRDYLSISLRNIEKLVTLIENLLDFSRLHRGDEEILFDSFNLVDCARTSMQIVQTVADSREISLILNAPEEGVFVEGDKGKLGQVFNNLLSNAVKFNRNGGSVKIDIRPSDKTVEVLVTDTGIGIPEEAQDKVFTRFYQYDASSTRKYGGTGIGLSIAQDIMRLHGSSITVSSTPGEGTTFRFVLSLPAAPEVSEGGGEARQPLPTETHLLIELVTQDRALSAQIRHFLVAEGMDVIHAAFPSAAVALAQKYSPDCILVDTEAGPLGSVLLDEIVSNPNASAAPVVLLTNDEELYERYRSQIAGRVKRSFRKSTLLSGIHYALSKGVGAGEQLGDKILCVDDDPEIVKFMVRCLENEGYETEFCATGEEALEMVERREYWLVLLDISMPGMDGWEACTRIKENPALAGIQVHMVTAKPMDKSAHKIHECGADGYILKPFRAEDLASHVKDFNSFRQRQGG